VPLVRKMTEDVADLVHLASLHEGSAAAQAPDRGAKALAPVDDEEPRAFGLEPALDQVLEHRFARDLVLRGSLPEAEHVLVAASVDSECTEHDVLAKVDAVDETAQMSRSPRGRAIHCASFSAVSATKRRLTALLLAPRVSMSSGSSSSERAYLRVATPIAICSRARLSRGSVRDNFA
jgi:hypothetical protein